jgi:hypothetical protein
MVSGHSIDGRWRDREIRISGYKENRRKRDGEIQR